MRYGSVCSGIEAASVAWEPLGWEASFFAEIEKFPSAVLSHRFPNVPNHGDFTTINGDEYGTVDLLVGGTPCQDFSIAGLRAGLAGKRGQLTIEFARLAGRLRPRWLVWENVPGVLSADGGRAFGIFLGTLAKLGYGFAYRVLDAQHFGVPQRRRRVFVVGYYGDWRPPVAVLFERESMQGNPAEDCESTAGTARSFPCLTRRGAGSLREEEGFITFGDRGVRHATPLECERLQGFPDGWTLIPWRRGLAADGPRYRALGNSMAVPCMRWIGERISQVEAILGGRRP